VIYAELGVELRQLRYLEAVARHRHFTRAAAELHVAQSAVSHQIRRLEQELAIELLERTTRSVELTAAGKVVVARAEAALAEADGIPGELDELRGLVRGTIVIGALLPAGPLDLPALLADFSERYPGIEIEFREGTSSYMREQLAAGALDAAFVLEADPQPPALGRLELSAAEMVLAMRPDHPLAAKAPLPIERLDGENLIAFRHGSSVRLALDRALERAGASPRIALEGSDLLLIRALAAEGFGVAVLPRSFAEFPGPPLAVRPLKPAIHLPVVLLWRKRRAQPPAARAFLDFVAETVSPR
jgi:DNA-binding transcriptional LysR family regulator